MADKNNIKAPAATKTASNTKAAAPQTKTVASQAKNAALQPNAAKETEDSQKRSLRADVARRREALKRQEAERALPLQILLILLNSLGSAVVAVLIAGVVIRQFPSSSSFADPEMGKLMLVMTFLLSFLLTLLILMRRLPENWWQLANEFAKSERYQAPDRKWGGMLEENSQSYIPLFDPTRKISAVPPSLTSARETPFAFAPEPTPEDTAAAQPEPQALFTDEPKSEEQQTEEALALAKAQAIAEIDKFTASLNQTIKSAARALNAASRFALQLYVAGACSAIAKKFLLSAKDAFALMLRALSQVGVSKTFAESFTTNIEEYARRDAYRSMIEDGQSAMEHQFDMKPSVAEQALEKFEDWSARSEEGVLPQVVTLLFTDIVDASALTQRLGNLHAQRVIKAHDTAVNEAVEKNKGKKIKHTGDGMIATFPDPAKAVAAAQAIQQHLDVHNKRSPHLSANVRISINAGEAVNENGDLFGATVKMTAQLCAMAKAGQILAADVVKSFCKSSQHAFNPFGEVSITELGKVRTVFEVTWMKSGAGIEYSDIGQPAG